MKLNTLLLHNDKIRPIGAVEKTRTFTPVKEQRPQRCASTNSATTARLGLVAGSIATAVPLVKSEVAKSPSGPADISTLGRTGFL
jgi:hypothetical protein